MKKLYIIPLLISMATLMLFNGCKKKTKDTATNVAVTQVTLNKDKLSLVIGTNETLVATITPENATNKNVSWSSGNTAVADVDNTGKVTAKATGTATITVTTADGAKTAICEVAISVATDPDQGKDFLADKNGDFVPVWANWDNTLFTPWTITTTATLSGTTWGGADGPPTILRFDATLGTTIDVSQTLSVSNGNYKVRFTFAGDGVTLKVSGFGSTAISEEKYNSNGGVIDTVEYDIVITTGTCTLGVYRADGDWQWGNIDKIELIKQ